MRKIKILSVLMAILLCSSILMVSCGDKEYDPYKVSDVMNSEWEVEKTGVVGAFKDTGYAGSLVSAKYNLAVTKFDPASNAVDGAAATGDVVTRVYDMATDKVIVTLTDSKSVETVPATVEGAEATTKDVYTKNYVDIISSKYFAAMSVSASSFGDYSGTSNYFGCPLSPSYEYTLKIYDVSGNVVDTFQNTKLKSLAGNDMAGFDSAYVGGSSSAIINDYKEVKEYASKSIDLYAIGTKLYRYDSEYNSELVKDYGLEAMPNIKSMEKVGDYYLEYAGEGTYVVYDKDLAKVYDYCAPQYADNETKEKVVLFSDGSLLVQYLVQLDQHDEKFDIRMSTDVKYDLVTYFVTAEKTKELKNVDYYIYAVDASVEDTEGKRVYSESIDNLAIIYPITEDKLLDLGAGNRKLVLMSNEAEITGEIVTEDKIPGFPEHYTEDSYAIRLVDGNYAIYNESGEKTKVITAAAKNAGVLEGGYVYVQNKGIYNADGSMVYDIEKEKASVYACGNTLLVDVYTNTAVKHGIFVNGTVKVIGTIDDKNPNSSTIDGFGYSASGYFYTYNKTSKKYTYYNTEGAELGSYENLLSNRGATEDYILLYDSAKKITYKATISK